MIIPRFEELCPNCLEPLQQKQSYIKNDNADLIGSETVLRQGSGPCGVLLSDMGDSLEVDGHGP